MRGHRTVLAVAVAAGLIVTTSSPAQSQGREMTETIIDGHTMYTLLKPGDIPAIFEPTFLRADDSVTEHLFSPEEPMLAVSDGNVTKAYSTWHLDEHEVVNDSINGTAIAATW